MLAFPPHRTRASITVNQSTALAHLSAYLTSSEIQPHLLPNAHFDSSHGPTVGYSNFSVTIHNLRRVEAGLRGELLAPSIDLKGVNVALEKYGEAKKSGLSEDLECLDEFLTQNYTATSEMSEETKKLNNTIHQDPEIYINDHKTELPLKTKFKQIDNDTRKRDKKARRKAQKQAAQKVKKH